MSWFKKLSVLFASSAMASLPIAASFAQGAPAGFMDAYDEEHEEAGVHCAGLSWHIDRVAQPDKTVNISGPIWYTDGSGVSFAQGKGHRYETYC